MVQEGTQSSTAKAAPYVATTQASLAALSYPRPRPPHDTGPSMHYPPLMGAASVSPHKRPRAFPGAIPRPNKRRRGPVRHQAPAEGSASVDEPVGSPVPADGEDRAWAVFVSAISNRGVGVYPVSPTLFLVQGWDPRHTKTMGRWYHLQRAYIGEEIAIACQCPLGPSQCFHATWVRSMADPGPGPHGAHGAVVPILSLYVSNALTDRRPTGPEVTLVLRDTSCVPHNNMFSVSAGFAGGMKGRAVVTYQGDDTGSGAWECLSHPSNTKCAHIARAQGHLLSLPMRDRMGPAHARTSDAFAGPSPTTDPRLPPADPNIQAAEPRGRHETSVSYQPVPLPLWACLPEEAYNDSVSGPRLTHPTNMLLGTSPRCTWHPDASVSPRKEDIKCIPSTIYTLTGTIPSVMEMSTPVLTHSPKHLLAAGWVGIRRRYQTRGSVKPFISDDLFRNAWFAYFHLQPWTSPKTCPICGPSPSTTIWDGITLAYSKKHLLPSLQPPTLITPEAPQRPSRRYESAQAPLKDKKMRQDLRGAICRQMSTVRHLETSDTDDGIVVPEQPGLSMSGAQAAQPAAPVDPALLDLAKRLQQVCPGLATLLEVATIPGPPGSRGPETQAIAQFLSQVAIDESVLQLVPPRAHLELGSFLAAPGAGSASLLTIVPAVSYLVSPWIQRNVPVPRAVLDALAWLLSGSREVWGRVLGRDTVIAPVKPIEPPDWQQLVVYDFACALSPYCLTREPAFFANTLFTVDDFHSGGHTKCSQASFLSTYAALDPRLAAVNTSAAECGNGGLDRIRKGAENPADVGGLDWMLYRDEASHT
ncbi:hypothetical protein JB92DRAFT_3136976 [Gautieria morchelliformis]|nr:hypothetical protein JB92DRAFT_3136976 [Gautieria morchelliformis]